MSQFCEEEEREGRSVALVEEEDEGFSGRFVVEAARLVDWWITSRGVWALDCLPNVTGN